MSEDYPGRDMEIEDPDVEESQSYCCQHSCYWSDGARMFAIALAAIAVGVVAGLASWAYVRSHDAEARSDVVEAEACESIEDEVERSECVRAID